MTSSRGSSGDNGIHCCLFHNFENAMPWDRQIECNGLMKVCVSLHTAQSRKGLFCLYFTHRKSKRPDLNQWLTGRIQCNKCLFQANHGASHLYLQKHIVVTIFTFRRQLCFLFQSYETKSSKQECWKYSVVMTIYDLFYWCCASFHRQNFIISTQKVVSVGQCRQPVDSCLLILSAHIELVFPSQ